MTDLLKGFLFQKVYNVAVLKILIYMLYNINYKEVYVSLKNDQYF